MIIAGKLLDYVFTILAARVIANGITYPLYRMESLMITHFSSLDPSRDSHFKKKSQTFGFDRIKRVLTDEGISGFWKGFDLRAIELFVSGTLSFGISETFILGVNTFTPISDLSWVVFPSWTTIGSYIGYGLLTILIPAHEFETRIFGTFSILRFIVHNLVPLTFPKESIEDHEETEGKLLTATGGWGLIRQNELEWQNAAQMVKGQIKAWGESIIFGNKIPSDYVKIPEDFGENLLEEERIELARRAHIWTTCLNLTPELDDLYDMELVLDWEYGMSLPLIEAPYYEYPDLNPTANRPWEESIWFPNFDVRPMELAQKFVQQESYGDILTIGLSYFPFDMKKWKSFLGFQVVKSLVLYPLNYLRIQMSTHSAFKSPKGKLYSYWKNSGECIQKNYKENGSLSFWKGYPLYLLETVFGGAIGVLGAHTNRFVLTKESTFFPIVPDPNLDEYINSNISGYSIVYPLEIIRRRMCQKDSVDSFWTTIKNNFVYSNYWWNFWIPSSEVMIGLCFGVLRIYLSSKLETKIAHFLSSQFSTLLFALSKNSNQQLTSTYLSYGISPLVPVFYYSSNTGSIIRLHLNQFLNARNLWYLDGDYSFLLN